MKKLLALALALCLLLTTSLAAFAEGEVPQPPAGDPIATTGDSAAPSSDPIVPVAPVVPSSDPIVPVAPAAPSSDPIVPVAPTPADGKTAVAPLANTPVDFTPTITLVTDKSAPGLSLSGTSLSGRPTAGAKPSNSVYYDKFFDSAVLTNLTIATIHIETPPTFAPDTSTVKIKQTNDAIPIGYSGAQSTKVRDYTSKDTLFQVDGGKSVLEYSFLINPGKNVDLEITWTTGANVNASKFTIDTGSVAFQLDSSVWKSPTMSQRDNIGPNLQSSATDKTQYDYGAAYSKFVQSFSDGTILLYADSIANASNAAVLQELTPGSITDRAYYGIKFTAPTDAKFVATGSNIADAMKATPIKLDGSSVDGGGHDVLGNNYTEYFKIATKDSSDKWSPHYGTSPLYLVWYGVDKDGAVDTSKIIAQNFANITTRQYVSYNPGSGSGNNSGGTSNKGSGGYGSAISSNAKPAPVSAAVATRQTNDTLRQALSSGSASAVVKFQNATTVTPAIFQSVANAAAKAGVSALFAADSMNGRTVESRVYVDPAAAAKTAGLDLSVSLKNGDVKKFFNRYFSNPVSVVKFGQQGAFGVPVQLATKADLTGLDLSKLTFYNYDIRANTITPIQKATAYIDAANYLHVNNLSLGGYLVISSGPIKSK